MVFIGIDLGTTNSAVAIFKDGIAQVIQDETGNRVIPSIVTYTEEKILAGAIANHKAHQYPEDAINDAKRFIGQKFYNTNVQVDISNSLYTVVNKDNRPHVRVTHKNEELIVSIEEVTAHLLRHIKSVAENHLNHSVTGAVIAVPAHYDDARRSATKHAAEIAGLKMVRIINEPTAAAIASQYKSKKSHLRRVLVYDFGGGTFDVSIVSVYEHQFNVITTDGHCYLGGKDIDANLLKYIKANNNLEVTDSRKVRRFKTICEDAKKKLSFSEEHTIELSSVADAEDCILTRSKLEENNEDLFQKTIELVDRSLDRVDLSVDDINEVVLVGGSSRIPRVRHLLETKFPKSEINTSINPDEAIAMGAAVYGGRINGEEIALEIQDILTHSIGIESWGGVMNFVMRRNTKLPCSTKICGKTSKNFQESVIYKILQGESLIASNNNLLGEFEITNIRRERRGVVKISTTMSINEEGILKVDASEVGADNANELTILITDGIVVTPETYLNNHQTHEEELQYVKFVREGNAFLNYCEDLKFDHRDKLQNQPDVLEKIEENIQKCKSLKQGELSVIDDLMNEIQLLAQEHLKD